MKKYIAELNEHGYYCLRVIKKRLRESVEKVEKEEHHIYDVILDTNEKYTFDRRKRSYVEFDDVDDAIRFIDILNNL